MMRVAFFTSGRQDWGILGPVAHAAARSGLVEAVVIAGGMHGRGEIPRELEGLRVDEYVETLPAGDRPRAVAQAAGLTATLLAGSLERLRADALLIAGDRTETLGAALAAACLALPIIHLHGGEESAGAIDNACRHAITKLSHLHFVAHADYARRIAAMGERPERVVVSGAPALDRLWTDPRLDGFKLARSLGLKALGSPLVLVTHHPATLGRIGPEDEAAAVIEGVLRGLAGQAEATVVVTAPNCDTGGQAIDARMRRIADGDQRFVWVNALGSQRYFSLMARAAAMVGNSSSGLLEAPSFGLPVVNVGDRQKGRLRIGEVFDVEADAEQIAAALAGALSRHAEYPREPRATSLGDGHAAERILASLEAFAKESRAARLEKLPVPMIGKEVAPCVP
ncbi:MAG: UDP-N-acetylglucosamine 2-epimerase (hydrolyzing) [Planctomycetota bacterium]|nr:UDP-N-acetylglucosamine 2-epimerase (hydrolyzing) [Planctomycetota bacterium]